jgi:hypothetical protein
LISSRRPISWFHVCSFLPCAPSQLK